MATTIAFSKYIHIYWIPLIPTDKKVYSECSHCKEHLEENKMPQNLKEKAQELKSRAKIPLTHFALLAIMGSFFLFAGVSVVMDSKEDKKQIASPKIGDKYEYKISGGEYSIMKVKAISKDSVLLTENS